MSFEVKSYEQLENFVEHRLFILIMLLVNEGRFEYVVLDKLEQEVHVGPIGIESDNFDFIQEDLMPV